MNAAIWENSRKLEAIEVMLGLGLAIFLSWVVTNWPEQAGVANVFLILLVFSGVIYAGKPLKTMQSVGFGVSERNALYALFAGAALGVFLTGSGFFIFNPLSALAVGSATLIFVGVVAPLAEETFFRGSLMPTLAELTGNAWLANGIQAGAFGLFHFLVSGGSVAAMSASAIFAFLVGAGNMFFKSTVFSYSAHLFVNLKVLKIV